MHTKIDHHFKLFIFTSSCLLSKFFFPSSFKVDLHSTNVSCATDTICLQMGFFQSPFEANETFSLPNNFVLFTNHKQPLKCAQQKSCLDL